MPAKRSRKQTWIAIILIPPTLIFAFVVGLFVYMNATVRPLHPDPQKVPSVTQWSPPAQWHDAVERSRQTVRAGVSKQNLPGVSVAVGIGGDVVWAEGFGWADLENHVPVTPGIRFRTGGVSMALTSAAVGLLLEKHRLDLEDEIQMHVPAFPKKQWPVTLRELMGHIAGVRSDKGDEEPLSERCDVAVDGLKRFAESPLLFEPGSRYRYSTYGWVLVSAAVEAASEEPFFSFMRTQVFKPLAMADTTHETAAEPITDRATLYYPKFSGDPRYGPEAARDGDYACFAGAGAFLSTPSDLVRFGMAINNGRLLKPTTVKTLQAMQHLTSGAESGYGLGWDLESVSIAGGPATMIGHDSEFTIGGSTSLATFPDRGIAVSVMTNTTFADTSGLALAIAQAFAERVKPARQ